MYFRSKKGVVIITGASRGLGKAIALKYGREGWAVLINYFEQKKAAEAVAEKVRNLDGEAEIYQADVSKAEDVKNMIDAAMKRWSRIDVLINNAGITRDSLLIKMKEEDWDLVLKTNLKGAFICIQQAARIFIQQKNGHIINIASIVGLQGRIGQANYAASKAGLIGLTKAAAIELGEYNVKVNAVIPGYLPTEMGADISDKIKGQIIGKNVLKRYPPTLTLPLEGGGKGEGEIADFVHYLSTKDNISGQVFNLDSRII
ncbi:MAG: SDR family NAD(P)-dependent oxidoreductase [Nitrospirae bacterium]|nr:SDR family NAD(P)-dependent oxidoreductase [Nitrospirota bacterium]